MMYDKILKDIPGLPFGTYFVTSDPDLLEALRALDVDLSGMIAITVGLETKYFIPFSESLSDKMLEAGLVLEGWDYMKSDLSFDDAPTDN